MTIGFAGTHGIMPLEQCHALIKAFDFEQATEFRHLALIGAAEHLVSFLRHRRLIRGNSLKIVAHLPRDLHGSDCHLISHAAVAASDEVIGEKLSYAAVRDIVDASRKVIIAPDQKVIIAPDQRLHPQEAWYMENYAWSRGKGTTIVWPDGQIEHRAGDTNEQRKF